MAMPMAEPDDESGQDTEAQDTITVPKSVLGDRQCKPGEKLTFTVVDVDPDSGDVEVKLTDSGYAKGGAGGGGNGDMDAYPMET